MRPVVRIPQRVSAETGTGLSLVELLPSCPYLFPPQQRTSFVEVKAQVWVPPAETPITPEESPTTLTGTGLAVVEYLPLAGSRRAASTVSMRAVRRRPCVAPGPPRDSHSLG
jgi:hypothetical protein